MHYICLGWLLVFHSCLKMFLSLFIMYSQLSLYMYIAMFIVVFRMATDTALKCTESELLSSP